VIKGLRPEYREAWDELVAVSTKSDERSLAIRPYLRDLRNDGVFHYAYHENLLAAYRKHFFTDAKVAQNEQAYVSIGRSFRETRFYFAHAAAQRMFLGDSGLDARFREADDFLEIVHHALAGFVWGYVNRP